MLRRLALLSVVGVTSLSAIACSTGTSPSQTGAVSTAETTSTPPAQQTVSRGMANIGAPLITAVSAPLEAVQGNQPSRLRLDPVVVPDCRLTVIDKVDVAGQKDGILRFIGTELLPGEEKDVPADQVVRVKTLNGEKLFRKLHEGDEVKAGQLVAQLDNRLALAELGSKEAKKVASEADYQAAVKTQDEALQRWQSRQRLVMSGSTVSQEDARGAKLTYERMAAEAVGKREAIKVAEAERNQAATVLEMHEIRTETPGIIKNIFKKPGEFVKMSETVLQVQDPTHLRVEAMVDMAYLSRVHKDMKVEVEQSTVDSPRQTLTRHLAEINSVAVSNDPARPLVLSASDDGTVRVWDVVAGRELRVLRHPAAVKAVACSPRGASGNWCVTGCDDGSVRLWNLDGDVNAAPREFHQGHQQAVRAVAISQDGKTCATAGDDLDICFWNTDTAELRYRVSSAHVGTVTSLQFTPESQLVSAGKDNMVRVWEVGVDGAKALKDFPNRSGDVSRLGVSPDGKHLLLDQGRRLQVLSLPDGLPEATLQNSAGVGNFTTLAQFSPDGKLILTASGSEGRLQLWRSPTTGNHATELRQLVPSDRATPTCAAFAPDGSFLVTATHDRHVMLWSVPAPENLQPRTATVALVDTIVDSSSRQFRVWATLDNHDGRLYPGTMVNMVIPGK